MIRAVGFDLDNTLYDQEQHVFPFFSAAATLLGEETGFEPMIIESTFRQAWRILGPSHPRLFNSVLCQHGIYDSYRVQTLVRMYHDYVGPLEVYPGVQSLLRRLRVRFPLFLITDGNAVMQRRKIERLGIGPLFQVVVFSAEHGGGLSKPNDAPFLNALRQLQRTPSDCVYVGDNPGCDVAGAARAGMRTVRVLTGPFRAESSTGTEADFTIDSVTNIEKILK
jgi:putative hydrolase of the HAD superfamily